MSRLNLGEEHESFEYVIGSGRFAPEIARAVAGFSLSVYTHSRLSLREFEAARIRIARINGCKICQNWRSARDVPIYLAKAGIDAQSAPIGRGEAPDESFYELVDEWQDAKGFSEREKLAIEYADRFARDHLSLDADEAFWGRLRTHFSDAEVVDLTLCIGSWITVGRFAHVLGLDHICSLPPGGRSARSERPPRQASA